MMLIVISTKFLINNKSQCYGWVDREIKNVINII